jgi:TRAP-type mannitol/chloroaromatic compound transport system permease small subunit
VSARVAALLERGVVLVAETLAWLVLAVVLLLFGQLPVRELFGSVGRAHIVMNDYGQLFHATVFLVGIAYAIAVDQHVRLDAFRVRFTPRTRAAIEAVGHLAFVLPWAVVLAYYGADPVWRSLTLGETFPDTGTRGYPLMRLAFAVFVVMLFAASLSRFLVAARQALGRDEA